MPMIRRTGSALGRTIGTTIRGSRKASRLVRRGVGRARHSGAAGETGMMRLFDLHAASCAGDTLITIGLAGTIFFNVPLGEARYKVALYLLVTMVPFALLAPVVGPMLDHFRHGRRYALAATMLGRAFLAWMISDNLDTFGLYPAAFGVLALSRAYGVARSAAVPRLLPEGLGLSQAGARASVYGTVAGAIVLPIGLAAFWFGPQWALRVASVIFLIGMVVALRLPPRADSDPPEAVPRPISTIFGGVRRGGDRPLSGRLIVATLIGSASLRGLYGFLLLFLAFAVKAGDLTTDVFGRTLSDEAALGLIGAALAVGTFLATAVGTRLRIHRPVALQSSGLVIVAGVAILATIQFSLLMVVLLCLLTATVSGIGKLSIDATIQERVPERLKASAFAHSETVLMLAFVAGGALGLIPLDGRVGVGVLAGLATVFAARAVLAAGHLRKERLHGRVDVSAEEAPTAPTTSTAEPPKGATPTAGMPKPGKQKAERPRAGGPRGEGSKAMPETAEGPAEVPGQPIAQDDDAAAPPGYHIYRPSKPVSPEPKE